MGTRIAPLPTGFDSKNQNTGTNWKYDASGNLIRDSLGREYQYDAEGHLVSAPGVTYAYDGEGGRVKKVTSSGTTIFAYDATGQLVAEYSDSPNLLSCTLCYVTVDHLGSTRILTEGAGVVSARTDYVPFGEEITPGGSDPRTAADKYFVNPGPLRFTGKERDAETGLDYFGARYYSGAQGRFTSPDPFSILQEAGSRDELDAYLSEPQRWNKYAYSLNNPLKYVDPDGNNPVLMQLLQRLSPYADKAAAAAQRWGGQASQAASRYGQQAYVWATRFFNSPTGQEVAQTAIETAVGYQGPSPTVTGNVGRLAKAEFETGVRLAQKLGQSVRTSEHVGAEFVSAAGKTFDALGTPEAYRFWNQGQFLKSIDKHLLKSNDFTVIDLTGASKSQVAAIQKHVSSLTKELQDKIMYVGN